MREHKHKRGGARAEGEGEADSFLSREPDTRLDPRGLHPEPKGNAQLTEPPRCP